MCEIIEMLKVINANQQIIYNKLKELELKECLWTEERICWLEERVLRNGLETANHDVKIVKILEGMGGVAPIDVDYVEEPVAVINETAEVGKMVKKGKKVK